MGFLDDALKIQKALENEFSASGESDPYVFEELGEIYLAMGDQKSAQPYFAKAYAELSKDRWLQSNEPERLSRLKSLAGSAE